MRLGRRRSRRRHAIAGRARTATGECVGAVVLRRPLGGRRRQRSDEKVRRRPDDPGLVMHTTIYLARRVRGVPAPCPHARASARRATASRCGRTYLSVDVFHDGLEGLVLAEVDLGDGGTTRRLRRVEPDPATASPRWTERRTIHGGSSRGASGDADRALEAVSGRACRAPELGEQRGSRRQIRTGSTYRLDLTFDAIRLS